jgi:hypothetical protein
MKAPAHSVSGEEKATFWFIDGCLLARSSHDGGFFFDLAKRFFIAKWERERGTRA